MIGLEDLLLANLLVRRGLATAADVKVALDALDPAPARGDLYGMLSSRNAALVQPGTRDQLMVQVRRYLIGRSDGVLQGRLRAARAITPATLDALLAQKQTQDGGLRPLAEVLVAARALAPDVARRFEEEVQRDLRAQEVQLVARHRAGAWAETTRVPGAGQQGPATREMTRAVLETSGELMASSFGVSPGGLNVATPPPSQEPVPEATIRLGPEAMGGAVDGGATLKLGPDQAATLNVAPEGGATLKIPAPATRPIAAPAPAPFMGAGPLAVGAELGGKFAIVSVLGKGGMGTVYRARAHERGDQEVALKAVVNAGGVMAEVVQRFKREILTATLVEHENVCAVYDAGEADGFSFMAMELVEGETLKDLVKREAPLAPARAAELIGQILRGVAACHNVKVIHRDLKPENVRVSKKDGKEVAKLVDFGIARLVGQDPVIAERVFMTVRGKLSGTPAYVAPELVEDPELVDARCDIYATGVIFYELLTGKLPFKAKSVREMLTETLESRPMPLSEAAPGHPVPRPLERFLFRLLEKDPLVRYQTAEAALEALAEASSGRSESERRGFTNRIVGAITRLFGRKPDES